jgi:hypothetical protein
LHPNTIDLYCRWLYQTGRADRKPRVLVVGNFDVDSAPIYLFIDRLKQVIMVKATRWLKNISFQDFLMATDPASFFIQINLPKAFQPQDGICLENGKTKERLLTEMEEAGPELQKLGKIPMMITRYPLASTKKLIVSEEIYEKKIYLTKELEVVAI